MSCTTRLMQRYFRFDGDRKTFRYFYFYKFLPDTHGIIQKPRVVVIVGTFKSTEIVVRDYKYLALGQ